MNSSSVSSFFSRDVFLRCQARSNRKRPAHTKLLPSTASVEDILPMIEEEDEPRASTSSSPPLGQCSPISPSGSQLKLKRRHVNLTLADIRLAKIALRDDSDFTLQDAELCSSPRPAPRPPASPSSSSKWSPDPFSLEFSRFPHPPISSPSFDHYSTGSESPTPSMSSGSSTTSHETQSSPLPTTPSSSNEFLSYYESPPPSFNPGPVIIKPLVITKRNRPAASRASFTSPSKIAPKCPLPPPPMPEDDSDYESDSEWYSRELSKILTLSSPTLPNPPSKARPDSVCISENPASSLKPPTPTTPARGVPSAQLDPSFPRRRSRISIPNYPPPPVPTLPKRVSVTPSSAKTSRSRSSLLIATPPPRRPPPRSSIPADCVLVDDTFTFSDDNDSVFSFSLYDRSPLPSARLDSPKSSYSQQSFQSPRPSPFPPSFPSTPSSAFPSAVNEEFDFSVEDIQFDMKLDHPVTPFLDLPTSPLDFEADLTSRFEQLRHKPRPQAFSVNDSSADEAISSSHASREPSAGDHSWELRSRWSSSTLNSVQEEHSRRSAIGLALRTYFGSSPVAKSKTHSSPSSRHSGSGSEMPKTPTSMTRRHQEAKRESDVMVIGYGHGAQHGYGHSKRRGSSSPSVSDVESEEILSRPSRKPISVEMFLRS